jgi:predicted Zn finger-like uncharacterized protein
MAKEEPFTMEVTCEKCQSKFKIPDGKIPADKAVTLPCPKCKNKISIAPSKKAEDTPTEKAPEPAPPPPQFEESDQTEAEVYDASDKPFDFLEEEGKTVLVCESDAGLKKHVLNALRDMEYQITEAQNSRDALKNMRYHRYDLIVVNEGFDTTDPDSNGVLIYIERLQMSDRRNTVVALISDRYRTMDNMMAFNKSVNMIINVENINDIAKILRSGIADYEYFYRVYMDSMKATGRI